MGSIGDAKAAGTLQVTSNNIQTVCSGTYFPPCISEVGNGLCRDHPSKMHISRHHCMLKANFIY